MYGSSFPHKIEVPFAIALEKVFVGTSTIWYRHGLTRKHFMHCLMRVSVSLHAMAH